MAEQNNSKLYFVYLPETRRYKSKLYNRSFFSDLRYKKSYFSIKKVVKELKIPFIDIHEEVFKDKTDLLKFFPSSKVDSHYNSKGYHEVAKTIIKYTKR